MSRRVWETLGTGDSRAAPALGYVQKRVPGLVITGLTVREPAAVGVASVNMAGLGVEAVIALRRALAPAGVVEPGQAAEGNQAHPQVSPGVPCEDWHPPPPAPV